MRRIDETEAATGLMEVLELEQLEDDLFRSSLVYRDPFSLYGGQVAAQALLAAGRTVAASRLPHSLHCYFLRPGDAGRPTMLQVGRDRDGASFSARRVDAVQDGKIIASLSCAFQEPQTGVDLQVVEPPAVSGPAASAPHTFARLFSVEGRLPEQDHPDAEWPLRYWARGVGALADDPLVHACVLTYISDVGSGVSAFTGARGLTNTSLDHALWFHRPVRGDDWVLTELTPHTLAGTRGWYRGSLFDLAGRLVASLAQETLSRPRVRR